MVFLLLFVVGDAVATGELESLGLAVGVGEGVASTVFDGVGVEKFAYHAYKFANELVREKTGGRCWVETVECAEHGANSAIYEGE